MPSLCNCCGQSVSPLCYSGVPGSSGDVCPSCKDLLLELVELRHQVDRTAQIANAVGLYNSRVVDSELLEARPEVEHLLALRDKEHLLALKLESLKATKKPVPAEPKTETMYASPKNFTSPGEGFADFFRKIGYAVTWDRDRVSKWHEIYEYENGETKSLVCQIDFGVPLRDFLEDLPFLAENRSGRVPSKSAYTFNCSDLAALKRLTARASGLTVKTSEQFELADQSTASEKLTKIAKMIGEWSSQPDPEPGESDSIEASDLLYKILNIAEPGT